MMAAVGIDVDKTSRTCCTAERCACFVTSIPISVIQCQRETKPAGLKRNRATSGRMVVIASKLSNFWSSSLLGLLKRKGLKGGLEILYSRVGVEDKQARQPIDHCKCFLGNFQKELVQKEVTVSKITFRAHCPSSANPAQMFCTLHVDHKPAINTHRDVLS